MRRRDLSEHELAQGLKWELWRASHFQRLRWAEKEANARLLADGYLQRLQQADIGLTPEI